MDSTFSLQMCPEHILLTHRRNALETYIPGNQISYLRCNYSNYQVRDRCNYIYVI